MKIEMVKYCMSSGADKIRIAIRHDPDNAELYLRLARALEKTGRSSCFVDRHVSCPGMCCAEWAYRQAWLRAPDDPLPPREIARIRDFENTRDIRERRQSHGSDSYAIADTGIIGDPSSREYLEKIFKDDSAPWAARRAAARAIGKLGIPETFETIHAHLPDWPEDVSDAILAGLGNLSHPAARNILKEAIYHSDFHHRLAAVEGLAVHIKTGAVSRNILVPLFSDSARPVAGRFLNMSIQDAGREVAQKAADIFGGEAAEDDLPVLEEMIKSSDQFIRKSAVRGLGRIGGAKAFDIIESHLTDPDPEGYWKPQAVRALGKAPDALKWIESVVELPEFEAILAACEVYYAHGRRKRLDDVSGVMSKGFSQETCNELIRSVMSLCVIDVGINDFYDSNLPVSFPPGSHLGLDEYFWNIAALALHRTGHRAAKEVIIDLVEKDRVMFEPQIFRAMANYKVKNLAAKLSAVVKEAVTFHLDLAVHVLGRIGGRGVIPVLQRVRSGMIQLDKPNVSAELAAHYALRRFDNK